MVDYSPVAILVCIIISVPFLTGYMVHGTGTGEPTGDTLRGSGRIHWCNVFTGRQYQPLECYCRIWWVVCSISMFSISLYSIVVCISILQMIIDDGWTRRWRQCPDPKKNQEKKKKNSWLPVLHRAVKEVSGSSFYISDPLFFFLFSFLLLSIYSYLLFLSFSPIPTSVLVPRLLLFFRATL